MSIRVVRLGTDRHKDEGLRLGTVRRPPRGVKKEDIARENYYDVWLPQLAPTQELVKEAQSASTQREWDAFVKKYKREMSAADNDRLLTALAALSHQTNFSVGCYCADEAHCHRSALRELLRAHGAEIE